MSPADRLRKLRAANSKKAVVQTKPKLDVIHAPAKSGMTSPTVDVPVLKLPTKITRSIPVKVTRRQPIDRDPFDHPVQVSFPGEYFGRDSAVRFDAESIAVLKHNPEHTVRLRVVLCGGGVQFPVRKVKELPGILAKIGK
jgi:hypothetical protein